MSADPKELFPAGEPLVLTPPEGVLGLRLNKLTLEEELGRPYRLQLDLVATERRIDPTEVLARPMVVHLNLGAEKARHFHGLVSEFRFQGLVGLQPTYSATLRPWLWFLSKTQNCRIFQNQSAPDIIKEVVRGYREFADFEETELAGHYEKREFLVQYQESDLAFVTRLMEEFGLYYYFRHELDRHTLVLCDKPDVHHAVPGYESLPFLPPDGQREEHAEYIEQWTQVARVEAGAQSFQHFRYEQPNQLLSGTELDGTYPTPAELEVYAYPTAVVSIEKGMAGVLLAVERQRCAGQRSDGSTNCRGVSCGHRLAMTGHAIKEYNIGYLIVSNIVQIHAHDLASGAITEAELVHSDFVARAANEPFRLARLTPRPVIHGVQTAVVAGPIGEEICTDGAGRVRVRFHWDRRGPLASGQFDSPSGPAPASCWIRVSQVWAGAGFGAVHLPRVGQEVIVEFLDGDPDRPIIVGRVYNGSHEAPFSAPTQSGIRSATVYGRLNNYNEIRFEDRKGAEAFHMQAERDQSLLVKRNRSEQIGADDQLTVEGNRSEQVKGSHDLSIGDLDPSLAKLVVGDARVSTTHSLDLRSGAGGATDPLDAGITRVTATQKILLVCGQSQLELNPDSIVLRSGTGASLRLDATLVGASKSDASKLTLDGTVKVTGTTVDITGPGGIHLNS
jgi:type VI secretion system secreted protein VgrG